jgi:hypothetical protein
MFIHKPTNTIVTVGTRLAFTHQDIRTTVIVEAVQPPTESNKSGYITTNAGHYYAHVYDCTWIQYNEADILTVVDNAIDDSSFLNADVRKIVHHFFAQLTDGIQS